MATQRKRSKPQLAEVITLHPFLDIPAMLREMADNIEKGEVVPIRSATVVAEHTDGEVVVYGWGETGLLRSIGVLHLGIENLTRMRLKQFEDQ